MKKNEGAAAGMVSASSRRRLPWTLATATSTVRPRPSESTTLRVGAAGPGEIGQRAAQHARCAGANSRRQSAMIANASRRKTIERGEGREHEPEGQHAVVAPTGSSARSAAASTKPSHSVSAQRRRSAAGCQHVAEQLAGRQIARAHQRRQRKGKRHQQAEAGGLRPAPADRPRAARSRPKPRARAAARR